MVLAATDIFSINGLLIKFIGNYSEKKRIFMQIRF